MVGSPVSMGMKWVGGKFNKELWVAREKQFKTGMKLLGKWYGHLWD